MLEDWQFSQAAIQKVFSCKNLTLILIDLLPIGYCMLPVI